MKYFPKFGGLFQVNVRAIVSVSCLVSALACEPDRALEHEVYAWTRSWTEAARRGISALPSEVATVRVLVLEHEGGDWTYVRPPADVLIGRDVVVVARVNGARLPKDITLAPLHEVAARLSSLGVKVVGIEVDHDAATAALDDYRDWLKRERRGARLSVTALPTWGEGQSKLCDVVDEMVLQVHAIRAPVIFNADEADRWVSARAPCATSISLPTYSARVAGKTVRTDPEEVARFLRRLKARPRGVERVLWFRAPSDHAVWPAATLNAIIAERPLVARVVVELVPRADGVYDIVFVNEGNIAGPPPALNVAAERVEIVRRPRALQAQERVVVGWARQPTKTESP